MQEMRDCETRSREWQVGSCGCADADPFGLNDETGYIDVLN